MKINRKLSGGFKKTVLFITVCVSVGIILAISGTTSVIRADNDATESPGDANEYDFIVIDNEGYEKDRKGPVNFAHKKHALEYKLLCWECHHEYIDGKNIYSPWGTTKKCVECHDPTEKQEKVMKLQTSYHLNCKICHKKMAVFGDNSFEYRKCNKCHEKAE
ncbi:cytochrome c3 family protein [Thermodesulfobacteriota bacterium]